MKVDIHLRALGCKTKVEIWGEGRPILLIHGGGIGSNGSVWRAVAPRLGSDHRVVVPDLLGFGASVAPDIGEGMPLFVRQMQALIELLCLEGLVVVGHSMGCRVALALALESPALVAAVGFLAPGGQIVGISDYHSDGHEIVGAAAADPTPEAMRAVVACMNARLDDAEAEVAERLALARDPNHLRALRSLADRRKSGGRMAAPGVVADVRAPVLLGWGDSERFNPPELGARIAARLPPQAVYRIFQAGHNIPHDAPAQAANAIAALAAAAR